MRGSEEARRAEKECEKNSHRQGRIMEAYTGVGLLVCTERPVKTLEGSEQREDMGYKNITVVTVLRTF